MNITKSSKIIVDYFGKLAPSDVYDVIYRRDRFDHSFYGLRTPLNSNSVGFNV